MEVSLARSNLIEAMVRRYEKKMKAYTPLEGITKNNYNYNYNYIDFCSAFYSARHILLRFTKLT